MQSAIGSALKVDFEGSTDAALFATVRSAGTTPPPAALETV